LSRDELQISNKLRHGTRSVPATLVAVGLLSHASGEIRTKVMRKMDEGEIGQFGGALARPMIMSTATPNKVRALNDVPRIAKILLRFSWNKPQHPKINARSSRKPLPQTKSPKAIALGEFSSMAPGLEASITATMTIISKRSSPARIERTKEQIPSPECRYAIAELRVFFLTQA
jgi:hypothetical protein